MNVSVNYPPALLKAKPEDAFRHPGILVVNEFNDESAKAFREQLAAAAETGQTVIPVLIDSFGGDVYSCLSMIDAIKASPVPVATIATGKALSAGAVLLTAGADGMRFAAPNASIMIHEVAAWHGGKVAEATEQVGHWRQLNRRVFRLMDANTRNPSGFFEETYRKRGRTDWFLSTTQAKGFGIINAIGVPALTMSISATYSLEIAK